MGRHGRARAQVGRLPAGPRMAGGAGAKRSGRPASGPHYQLLLAADAILAAEVTWPGFFTEERPLRSATTAVRRAPNGRRGTPGGRLAPVRRPQWEQRRAIIWYSVTCTASGRSSTT